VFASSRPPGGKTKSCYGDQVFVMNFERLIAQRYLRSKRQLRFITIIMLVSVIGITVGVAALIIVLSVFNGFNGVVTRVLLAFDPHVRIEAPKGSSMTFNDTLYTSLSADPSVAAVSPFVSGKVLLMTSSVNRVVTLRGIGDSAAAEVSGVPSSIVLGAFKFDDTAPRSGIVLGLSLADRLGAMVGSEVTIVSPVGVDAMLLQYGQPLTRRCTVVGIYDSHNKDYDSHFAYVSMATAQSLFSLDRSFTGYEVRLRKFTEAEDVKTSVVRQFGDRYTVSTWYDLHRGLYSVMKIERWSAYVILCLIVAVAVFNVLGSLTMGVIEKRRDIGILRAMGATRSSITKIFMVEGLLVGGIGTLLGLCIGYLVCWLQITYALFPLDTTVYIIPAIPVEFRLIDFLAVTGTSMGLCTLASVYPAYSAATPPPIEAIRWE
jgi:lipoprotein-releasing system permease protein